MTHASSMVASLKAHNAPTVYVRRDIGRDGQPISFTSYDAADRDAWGWFKGWLPEGAEFEGHRIKHVFTPSWRCPAPLGLEQSEAA